MFAGFSFSSKGFQHAISEVKTDGSYRIIERELSRNPAPGLIRESANWLHDNFEEIFQRHDIARVGFKAHFKLMTINDLYAHGLPIGVLASFCAERDIPVDGFTVGKIKSYKFLGLNKGENTLTWVDAELHDAALYWTNDAKYSVAIASHLAISH